MDEWMLKFVDNAWLIMRVEQRVLCDSDTRGELLQIIWIL